MPTSTTAPFTLSFEQSGKGELPITLAHVQTLALDLGYVKEGADPTKPLGARVDLKAFFDAYAVKAFSTWKQKFCSEPLVPIGPGGVPMTKPKVRALGTKQPQIPHLTHTHTDTHIDPPKPLSLSLLSLVASRRVGRCASFSQRMEPRLEETGRWQIKNLAAQLWKAAGR